MVDAELSTIAAHGIVSLIKIWAVHIQNAICNIVALCAAHREEGAALQLERLPARQVNDVRADFVYFAAVPFLHGIFVQGIEVFVIAVHN